MKYSVEGFDQQAAVKLGLNAESLVILRWFLDFWRSGKMKLWESDGKLFAWVSYEYLQEELPIIRGSKKTIAAKFDKLCTAGVLEHKTRRYAAGTFSYYKPGPCLQNLLTFSKISETGGRKNGDPVSEKTECIDSSITNTPLSSTHPSHYGANAPVAAQPRQRSAKLTGALFVPPTVEQVRRYCDQNNLFNVDPEWFVEYYEMTGWELSGGKSISNWQAVATYWQKRSLE